MYTFQNYNKISLNTSFSFINILGFTCIKMFKKKSSFSLWLIFISCFLVFSNLTYGQEKNKKETDSVKNFDLKVMPYISYNRNLEFMIGAIPMAMYRTSKTDTISPKSLSGLVAVYTTNKSYVLSGFTKLYFAEDYWRLKGYAFTGNLNSQVYIEDVLNSGFYDYNTVATIFFGGAERKIYRNIYAGLGYGYARFNSVVEESEGEESKSTTHNMEISLLSDTRNDQYYPTLGHNTQIKWRSFAKWLGNDQVANKIIISHNQYIPLREDKDVLAARIHGEFGLGTILFEQQVVIGGKDIRGYSESKYRGDGLLSLQGEYRWNFGKKMGLVGFAGVATIYGSQNPDFDWKLYPGGGLGYRYKVFKDSGFNIGLDAAVGKEDWGVNFRIGESF